MPYEIEFTSAASRDLDRIRGRDFEQVDAKIVALAEEPRPAGSSQLRGYPNYRRVRCGAFRIVYRIEDDRHAVVVVAAANRRDIYKAMRRRT